MLIIWIQFCPRRISKCVELFSLTISFRVWEIYDLGYTQICISFVPYFKVTSRVTGLFGLFAEFEKAYFVLQITISQKIYFISLLNSPL